MSERLPSHPESAPHFSGIRSNRYALALLMSFTAACGGGCEAGAKGPEKHYVTLVNLQDKTEKNCPVKETAECVDNRKDLKSTGLFGKCVLLEECGPKRPLTNSKK